MELTTRQKNALAKKGITSAAQLRRYTPLRYIDNTTETGLSINLNEQHAVVIGEMISCKLADMKKSYIKYISCLMVDRKSGFEFHVSIFGKFYSFDIIRRWIGMNVLCCGKLKFDYQYGFSIGNPDTFTINIADGMRYIPVYRKIKGISDDTLQQLIDDALSENEEDTIPSEVLEKYSLCDINSALRNVMLPKSQNDVMNGEKRLLFDDMYYLAARFVTSTRKNSVPGVRIDSTKLTDNIISSLPYQLTAGQKDTYLSIRGRLLNGQHFKALIQGDVGCGKTIVAFLSMLLVAGENHQACLMAPTQILAEQHYLKLSSLLSGTGIRCVLIESGKQSKEDLKAIKSGEALIAIGTHSLISDKVQFKDLVLIVIDEEHKFGVKQRNAIEKKTDCVDSILMSATPIPRTLAGAIYGNDTDIYSIRDMPQGRKPVITYYDDTGKRTINFVRKVLESGHQVYAVCPMIEEAAEGSTMDGVVNTGKALAIYKKYLPEYQIAELTGATDSKETERILNDFKENKIQMLISTTVVEVGVDVPNATLMVIHNAERFGLAGMHQLRGRVGRGSAQSYCILVSKNSPNENERLMTLCNTTDGFEIAEKDMKILRKSGNLFGTEQSGRNKYIEEMIAHEDVYKTAMKIAEQSDTESLERHIQKIVEF